MAGKDLGHRARVMPQLCAEDVATSLGTATINAAVIAALDVTLAPS